MTGGHLLEGIYLRGLPQLRLAAAILSPLGDRSPPNAVRERFLADRSGRCRGLEALEGQCLCRRLS